MWSRDVENPEAKTLARQRLNRLIHLPEIQTTLPFSHAQFLTLEKLRVMLHSPNQEWMVARFLNRDRCLLLLMKNPDPLALVIYRNGKMTLVKVHAPLGWFDGTLLDGHLSAHNTFMIIDVLACGGQSLCDDDYVTRMRSLLVPALPADSADGCLQLRMRPFWLVQDIPKSLLDNPSDLIFIFIQGAWGNGRSISAFRFQRCCSIDFAVVRTPRTDAFLQLAVKMDNCEPSKRILQPVVTEYAVNPCLLQLLEITNLSQLTHPAIMEFQFHPKEDRWHPIRLRKDRKSPNRLSTWERAQRFIQDHAKISALLESHLNFRTHSFSPPLLT